MSVINWTLLWETAMPYKTNVLSFGDKSNNFNYLLHLYFPSFKSDVWSVIKKDTFCNVL